MFSGSFCRSINIPVYSRPASSSQSNTDLIASTEDPAIEEDPSVELQAEMEDLAEPPLVGMTASTEQVPPISSGK